ncbi:MAG: ribonuclease P protein component [Candidatus Promineofilum sp.]|nr:ribonuclease P protein component [Promineifilum sp.]
MLPSPFRLRRSDDIARVRHKGRRWQHPLIVLFVNVQPQESSSVSRFAFVAGRHIGRATVRNRAKRRVREIVRHHLDTLKPGHDCLWVVRPPIVVAEYAELERAVLELLTRAGLRHDDDHGRSPRE